MNRTGFFKIAPKGINRIQRHQTQDQSVSVESSEWIKNQGG